MTRKDYILLAEALRESLDANTLDWSNPANHERSGIHVAISHVCKYLAKDNPRFNKDHFLAVVRGERDLQSRPPRG